MKTEAHEGARRKSPEPGFQPGARKDTRSRKQNGAALRPSCFRDRASFRLGRRVAAALRAPLAGASTCPSWLHGEPRGAGDRSALALVLPDQQCLAPRIEEVRTLAVAV